MSDFQRRNLVVQLVLVVVVKSEAPYQEFKAGPRLV